MPPRRRLVAWRAYALAHRGDLVALALLALVAIAFLAPALKDGTVFGSFDLDTTLTSLGQGLYPVVHSHANGDSASQMATWNALDWKMVHSGHFPLWNEYSVLGMPEFTNFESSVLSLPDLVSYLVPLKAAFLTAVMTKLLLAGFGTYLAARVLGLAPLAAFVGGATFMLSGAFSSWVTWPLSDVFCWCGFLVAFALRTWRSRRASDVVGLALSVAFSIFGGFPEANVMVLIGLGTLALVVGLRALLARRRVAWRPLVRVAGALGAGGLLAAPLWWPGLQVISLSHRTHDTNYVGLPTRTFALLLAQGYYGLPTGRAGTVGFSLPRWNYYETASYVGVVALVLSVVALGAWRRRPLVLPTVVALVVVAACTYEPRDFHPFFSLIGHLPLLSSVRFERMRTMGAFLVALLGAVGVEELASASRRALARRLLLVGIALGAACTGYLLVDSLGSGYLAGLAVHPAPAIAATLRHQRLESLLAPTLGLAALLLVWVALGLTRAGIRRVALPLLSVVQVATLFFAGVGIASYSKALFPRTPAIAELQHLVGGSLLGLDNANTGPLPQVAGVRSFGNGKVRPAGLYPNLNVGYGIHLFGVHDPLTPVAYYATWPVPAASPVEGGVGLFVPAIDSAALARRYGISYVIAPGAVPPPSGTSRVATIAGEALYKVPGAARFSVEAGRVKVLGDSGDGSYALDVTTPEPERILLGVSDLPGWHVRIDGVAVRPQVANGVMLSVEVPAGRHLVQLAYLPRRLIEGLLAALGGVLALSLSLSYRPLLERRGRRVRPDEEGVRPD
jgi:Bacterial membrane protein YfhO